MNANRDALDTQGKQASTVKLHRVPNWFRDRLLSSFGPTSYGASDGYRLLWHWANRRCSSTIWLDHWGTVFVDDTPLFVSEPYLLVTDDLSDAEKFAESLGCRLLVDERSHHYPGKTLRLTFDPMSTD